MTNGPVTPHDKRPLSRSTRRDRSWLWRITHPVEATWTFDCYQCDTRVTDITMHHATDLAEWHRTTHQH